MKIIVPVETAIIDINDLLDALRNIPDDSISEMIGGVRMGIYVALREQAERFSIYAKEKQLNAA
jgi:hypothetical protein